MSIARRIPINGTISFTKPVKMFTVIAIPPVAKHNAKRRAYDKTSPKKPKISITPYAPLAQMSIPIVATINIAPNTAPTKPVEGSGIPNFAVKSNPETSRIIPASKTNQHN